MSAGTELQGYDALAPEVRDRWQVEMVQTIRNTKFDKLSFSEFQMAMALAAKYDLDPLLGELIATRGKTQDGSPGRLLLMVPRDGLLRNASRHPAYKGFRGDVVHENDDFQMHHLPDGTETVEHHWRLGDRGPIVGAWAQVYRRDGHPPVFYFAPWDEYVPRDLKAGSSWKTNPSAMIRKVPLSWCLRMAFELTGVVGEEEMAQQVEDYVDAAPELSMDEIAASVEDDALRARLLAAYAEARDVRPGQITPVAVQMSVVGMPFARQLQYVQRLEGGNAQARIAAQRDAPADADVVPDEEPDGPSVSAAGGEGDASEQPVPGPRAEALSDAPAAPEGEGPDVERLRARLAELYDTRASIDPEDPRAESLDGDIAYVEGALAEAGANLPGQEAMDV